MFLTLLRKEILGHILSLRFGVTFALFLVLVFASMYVAVNKHRNDVDSYADRVRANEEALEQVLAEDRSWDRYRRLFYDEGKNDAVRGSPYAWLGEGLQGALPATVNTKGYGRTENFEAALVRSPLLELLRTLDFVYVVNVMLSLLAILFMFDAVCGEKEDGTLRLMLSNAVPRHDVLLGKWIGGYLVLQLPFLVAVGGGLLYAYTQGVFQPDRESLLRVGLLMGVAALYIAAFFNLSLFVSATTQRASTSLLVCLFLWVVFVLVVPNLAPVTAKILEPTPTPQSIQAEKEAVDNEIELKKDRVTQISGDLQYGEAVEEEMEELDREGAQRKRKWDQYYLQRRAKQTDLAATLGRLTPSACWVYAATSITNTGLESYEAFEKARRQLAEAFDQKREEIGRLMRRSRGSEWPDVTAQNLPSFHMRYPTLQGSLQHALNDILILVIVNVLFFMLAFVFFLRYDVR